MKKILVVLVLIFSLSVLLSACGSNPPPEGIKVSIERRETGLFGLTKSRSCITIFCESAVFKSDKRIIAISNPAAEREGYFIGFAPSKDIVYSTLDICGVNKFVIHIPDDASYTISIGDRKYILPPTSK